MSTELTITQPQQIVAANQLTSRDLVAQVSLIQDVMKSVMKEGEHFGVIPGCGDKPTLLKPGAEKLGFTFRLSPSFIITKTDMQNGHREYEVVCTLSHINTGQVWGQGVGSCSTMESKYRYRGTEVESTGKQVPKAYWDKRDAEVLGGKEFTASKVDGQWMICRKGEKKENDNPADQYNTVLKMAKKRAHVDAMLTCTAASDIFTQDIEDFHQVDTAAVVVRETKPAGNGHDKEADKFRDDFAERYKWFKAFHAEEHVMNILGAAGYEKASEIPADKRAAFLRSLDDAKELLQQEIAAKEGADKAMDVKDEPAAEIDAPITEAKQMEFEEAGI
jgi:hypothetical protein